MNGTRIEILKEGVWTPLGLFNNRSIKYNALVNKIGLIGTREISHSNTFSLPNTFQNSQALDLNIFNKQVLAKALNSKYEAKYYIDDILFRIGFLIINNTQSDIIKVNFIDEALGIIDFWKELTYFDLLVDQDYRFSQAFYAPIESLKTFPVSKSSIVTPVPDLDNQTYSPVSFPNDLNTIGDKFQLDTFGGREKDTFNPFQSRPLFNVKFFMDAICHAFGYSSSYDQTVDIERLKKLFIVPQDSSKTVSLKREIVTDREDASLITAHLETSILNFSWRIIIGGVATSEANSRKPSEFPNWADPTFALFNAPYLNTNCIIVPRISESYEGDFTISCNFNYMTAVLNRLSEGQLFGIWSGENEGDNTVYNLLASYYSPNIGPSDTVSVTLQKSLIEDKPDGAGDFIGLFFYWKETIQALDPSIETNPHDEVEETYLKNTGLSFTENGEFSQETVDLTLFAPRVSLQKLLTNILQLEGILLDINTKNKLITFFSYNTYNENREANQYNDWSKYLLKYDTNTFNTDYGKDFGKTNQISLNSPYIGNVYNRQLSNYIEDSKYSSLGKNENGLYKDVSAVNHVNNFVKYFEYENLGIGLVQKTGVHDESLEQITAQKTSAGNFTHLDKIENVNFGSIPSSLDAWYNLVDTAVRATPKFLLPVSVMESLDLKQPVYIEGLGGFYIIEQISEYVNGQTPVSVKLIKLTIGDDL